MSFYHDVKEHMSPSALSSWLTGRGQFTRSYFAGEKSPETKAMKAGTEIHALIEGGIIKAQKVYKFNEETLVERVPGTDFKFLGRPDSFSPVLKIGEGYVEFVDYKSGKANGWDEKLPADIKMRATAWLVWMHSNCPAEVKGHVEFIQTTWDPATKAVVPLEGAKTEVSSITYSADELDAFTKVIANAMRDVNAYYEKWKESTGEFVNVDDIAKYVTLTREIEKAEMERDEVEERIQTQMEFGGEENHKTPYGTFFVKRTKTFEYPPTLKINYLDYGLMLEDAEGIGAAAKAAKSNFELANEPKEVKTSIQFRAAKEK